MTSSDAVEILGQLDAAGVRTWVDGGWGVDALVGAETRPHGDLDLALDRDDLAKAQHVLEDRGFAHDRTVNPDLPARLVMRDGRGRVVDLHPLVFDQGGNGWQQLSASGRAWGMYPVDDLHATGVVGGRVVECLSARLQLHFHLGYEWSDRDAHDIRLLVSQLQLPTPPPLERD